MSAVTENISDFDLFLSEVGLTRADMDRARSRVTFASLSAHEQVRVVIGQSKIDGLGVFAKRLLHDGEPVAPVMFQYYWSSTGRYLNHSAQPNVRVEKKPDGFWFVAAHDIAQHEELTVNYRDVREAIVP